MRSGVRRAGRNQRTQRRSSSAHGGEGASPGTSYTTMVRPRLSVLLLFFSAAARSGGRLLAPSSAVAAEKTASSVQLPPPPRLQRDAPPFTMQLFHLQCAGFTRR